MKAARRSHANGPKPPPPAEPPPSVATGSKDYSAIAEQYSLDVKSAKIDACKWVRLACRRHLDDLDKQKLADYPYYFDAQEANRVCARIEEMPHIKGRWAAKGQKLLLEPWQCFIVCSLFGWRLKATKKRRFRRSYIQIPRKNAKSTLAAAIGNVMCFDDGEHGAEVYAGATSEKQAWEVFGPAKLMLEKSPKLLREWGVEVWARALVKKEDASKFWPVIGKPGDGASPHCSITDEYHEHATSDQVDTMQTGMGAREQPLSLIITTAGTNIASPCHNEYEGATKMLLGLSGFVDEQLFAIMYGIDEPEGKEGEPGYLAGDDWADPKVLQKANPNWGVSVDPDYLLAQQREAIRNPAHQNRFKTKHLDVWCNASVAGINMHDWRLATDAGLSVDEFEGQSCIGAIDLASKSDIADYVKVFWKMIDTKRHYYVFARHYLPEQTIEQTEEKINQLAYRKWVATGRLIPTEGAEIDFDRIRDDVKLDSTKHQFVEIVYDPWRATQLSHQLAKDGAMVVELGQSPKNMGEAFDELNAALKSGRFHHDGDPVLEWMASNVIAKSVQKGLTVPSKDKKENKIDGIVATVMAISRAMHADSDVGFSGFLNSPVAA